MKTIIAEASEVVLKELVKVLTAKLDKANLSYSILNGINREDDQEPKVDFLILKGSAFREIMNRPHAQEMELNLSEKNLVGDFFIQGEGEVPDLSKVIGSKYYKLRKVGLDKEEADARRVTSLRVAIAKIVDEIIFLTRSDKPIT